MVSVTTSDEYWAALARLSAVQDRESALIGHRMTWLMTLNGFLIAGAAALLASRDDLAQGGASAVTSWSWTITVIATVGLISNLSILYSNYWADRAIQSADAAFMNVLTDAFDEREVRKYLRLAGRDPDNMPRRQGGGWKPAPFFSPIEKILHPWFLLPAAFSLTQFALPALEIVGHEAFWSKFGAQVLVLTALTAIMAVSHRRANREPDAHLRDAVRDRVHQVDQRVVRGGNAYAEERDEISRAGRAVKQLKNELGLGRFVRALGARSGKPNLVLLFDGGVRDQRVVLKVHGRPQPAEAAVQSIWARAGLCVVPLLEWGDEPTTWLLMPELEGATLPVHMSVDERLQVTATLAELMSEAHELERPLSSTHPTLVDGVSRHLRVALKTLQKHGYEVSDEWAESCTELYGHGRPTLLHGDLALGNVMRDRDGHHLWVLDACGYIGPAAFDAARWCARFENPDFAVEALERWMACGTMTDQSLAYQLLGAELLMQAGVRELIKDERGDPHARRRDACTLALVEAGSKLIPR